jgi:mobilization protein NikA
MAQINIRVSEEEKQIIQAFAKKRGISTSEFTKSILFNEIAASRVDLAFTLLKEGKIYRKRAWKISGLNYSEFMREWAKKGIEEQIPDEIIDYGVENALNIDISDYLKE